MSIMSIYYGLINLARQLEARELKKKTSVQQEGASKTISVQDKVMKKDFLSSSDPFWFSGSEFTRHLYEKTRVGNKNMFFFSIQNIPQSQIKGRRSWVQTCLGAGAESVCSPCVSAQLPPPVQRHLVEKRTDDSQLTSRLSLCVSPAMSQGAPKSSQDIRQHHRDPVKGWRRRRWMV